MKAALGLTDDNLQYCDEFYFSLVSSNSFLTIDTGEKKVNLVGTSDQVVAEYLDDYILVQSSTY